MFWLSFCGLSHTYRPILTCLWLTYISCIFNNTAHVKRLNWEINMRRSVAILVDHFFFFVSFYSYGVISYSGLWRHNTVSFEVHIVARVCVGLTPRFKYSQYDRHSIYLDVYRFEPLGMGNAWAGIHIRKGPIWTSSSGEHTRVTRLTRTGFEWFLSEQVMSVRRSNSNVSSETQKWDLFVSLNSLH